nr:hypothetical protein [uncultured Clostridium sp.]
MANITGHQPDIKFCPACGSNHLRNIPRAEMKTNNKGDKPTHTYECLDCKKGFEINQHR